MRELRRIADAARGRAAWIAVDEIQAILPVENEGTLIYIRGLADPLVVKHLTVDEVARQLGLDRDRPGPLRGE